MATNYFSDLMLGTSNLLESIPILGDILKYADKFALNSDPSQLGTAAVGKLIGGQFENDFTSEEARKGASHVIGTAALSYLLGGASGSSEAGAAAPVASEAGGSGGVAVGSVSSGEAGANVTAQQAAQAMAASEAGGAGGTAVGTLGGSPTLLDKLAGNPLLIKYMTGLGSDLMKYGSAPDQGMQYTGVNEVTASQVKSQEFSKLVAQLLSSDESSGKFDKNGITINTGRESSLYKDFMGESSEPKSALATKDTSTFFTDTKLSNLTTSLDEDKTDKVRQRSMFSNAANPFSV